MARAARLVWVDRVPLAFGLDWIPLLDDPEAARARARRLGASHRVVSGDPPAALGLGRGLYGRGRDGRDRGRRLSGRRSGRLSRHRH